MTPTIYCADHQHAKVVCSAFAEGCGGKLVPAMSRLREGPAAMWGILRGAGERIKECELYGIPYFYIDHGYFRRGHYDGYYRVVFCDRHLHQFSWGSDSARWDAIGIEIKPWRPFEGDHVLYLPVSRHVAAYTGMDAGAMDEYHISRLQEEQGLPVRVKEKAEGDIREYLDGARLVAGWQSNALVEAAIEGVPVQELGGIGPGRHMMHYRGREGLCHWLANNQWTLAEMRSGKCWADLMARYGDRLTEAAA